MFRPLGLESVLVVIEMHQVALFQHRLVLEAVLHLERHLAAAPVGDEGGGKEEEEGGNVTNESDE